MRQFETIERIIHEQYRLIAECIDSGDWRPIEQALHDGGCGKVVVYCERPHRGSANVSRYADYYWIEVWATRYNQKSGKPEWIRKLASATIAPSLNRIPNVLAPE